MQLSNPADGAAELRRALVALLADVGRRLDRDAPGDADVHRARKDLKRARAALRWLRPSLGRSRFAIENRALRDAGRALSGLRDARVLADTLDAVVARAGLAPGEVDALRREFARERRAALAAFREHPAGRSGAADAVRAVRRRLARVALPDRRWAPLGEGLEAILARARDAYAAARAQPTAERLHEWRKQVKHAWHVLEWLVPAWPRPLGALAREAHRLADVLGEDHDLALLLERVRTGPMDPGPRARVATAIVARREDRQALAFAIGARLHAERPKRFAARCGEWWRAWAAERPPALQAGSERSGKARPSTQTHSARSVGSSRSPKP